MLVCSKKAYLLESTFVINSRIFTVGLVGKGSVGENIVIVLVVEVLLVLEDGIKVIHTISSQNADIPDHASHASRCESASGESNEYDFIASPIVRCDEAIHFTNVLYES